MSAHKRLQISKSIINWTILVILAITVQARTDQDTDGLNSSVESAETTTEQSNDNTNKVLINIDSLQDNCKFDRDQIEGHCICNGFQFDQLEEVAFFELPTKVLIAPDGATYDLAREQRLTVLTITNSTFANFPLHLFYELPLLTELDMRQCGIQHVTWECFLAADKLQILLLSDNSIGQLNERCFSYASKLEYLFLNNNALYKLHPDTFKGLSRLRHLDLSSNQLEELPERLFEELPVLQQLTIYENRLRFISNNLFAQNAQLNTMILHSNQLRELGEHAFRAATNLLIVDLSHNPELEELVLKLNAGHLRACNCSLFRVNLFGTISNVDLSDNRIQELYFPQSEVLQHLKLRNNSLNHLVSLKYVPRLRFLDLADNQQLEELPADWQTPQLERLDLSNTGLKQLPLAALRGMPQLRKLNVSVNNISEIDPRAFGQLTQLTHFFIHANNWNCFNLKMVMDMLISEHGISYSVDKFNADFPGAYINGIACMYRLPQRDQLQTESKQQIELLTNSSNSQSEYLQYIEPNEVEKLRQELKSVVQHFELKLDGVYAQLSKLNAKMQLFENLNNTLWNQMTISV